MSIIIKGMKMPQNCYDCRYEGLEFYNHSAQSVCEITGKKVESCDRPSWCPLVPVDENQTIDVRKKGHWISAAEFEECSVCHGTHLKEFQTVYGKAQWIKSNFCPSCGADMRGVKE